MASLEADLTDVHAAIAVIESAAKVPTRSRATNVAPFVEEISEHAYQFGLPTHELKQVIDILSFKNELDQTSRTILLRNLIPAGRVPSSVAFSVLGALGNGAEKPSVAIQNLLLRWLTATHDVLEEPAVLLRAYGVLFNLLDMISIRTALCQLLELITRRKHVRPFRIQRLLTLCQQFGNDQALISLLRVYKNFCPEIVISQGRTSRIAQSPFDSEWRARLLAVQESSAQMLAAAIINKSGFKVHRTGPRKSNGSVIPEVQTFHVEEYSITLEEIGNVSDFVANLERIEPPSQLIAVLNDPLLRRYAALGTSTDLGLRVEYWLERYLEDELELLQDGFGLSTTLRAILTGILSFTDFTKQLSPTVERFLCAYIPQWDGDSNLGLITDLVTYITPRLFDELYTTILKPLERAILSTASKAFATLLDFYRRLVCRWLEAAVDDQQALPSRATAHCLTAANDHVSTIMISALITSSEAETSIIDYLDTTCSTTIRCMQEQPASTIPVLLLPEAVYYLLLFSSSLSNLSRLCAVLSRYYRSILNAPRSYTANFTATLNTFLMDSCNVIYRARGFVTSDKNSRGCLMPRATGDELQRYLPELDRDYSLAAIFGFSSHPCISSLALVAFKELEHYKADKTGSTAVMHAGAVGQRSLVALANEGGVEVSWKEFRLQVLRWLGERGLNGIQDFLFAIIKDLSA